MIRKAKRAWDQANPGDWYAVGCIFAPLVVKKEKIKCPRILLVVNVFNNQVLERFGKRSTADKLTSFDLEYCINHLVKRHRPKKGIILLMSTVGSILSLAMRKSISFQVVPLIREGCAFHKMSRGDRNKIIEVVEMKHGLQCHIAHLPQIEKSFYEEWKCLRTDRNIKQRSPFTTIPQFKVDE